MKYAKNHDGACAIAKGGLVLSAHCAICQVRHEAVCGALGERDLPAFAALSTHVSYQAGQTICEEAAVSDSVLSITRGVVGLHKALPDGRKQTTGFLLEGDFLGLSSPIINSCGAEAITDVEACRFSRPRFEIYLDEHPELRTRLLRMAADDLSAAQDQMLLLGRKTARERVATFVLQLADRAAARRRPSNPVVLRMRRLAIADYLGLTIETVSRALGSLCRADVIELRGVSVVHIRSMASLRRMADGD